jgi:segregation and condensation protein B
MTMQDLNNIIESLLFVADEPLTIDKLKGILEAVDTGQIKSTLQVLADQYEARGGAFKLYEVAGGWQLRSRPEYSEWIKRLLQPAPQRLSKPALETLAIVAYNQPIIRSDIEHIRGVDCGGVLRQLMERKLVRVLGRKEIPGRPLIYATTKLFLELFGLKNIKDLPSPKEIEEMAAAMEEVAQPGPPAPGDLRARDDLYDSRDFSGPGPLDDEVLPVETATRPDSTSVRPIPSIDRSVRVPCHGHPCGSALALRPRAGIVSRPPRVAHAKPEVPNGRDHKIG